jgi:hypothetical protein
MYMSAIKNQNQLSLTNSSASLNFGNNSQFMLQSAAIGLGKSSVKLDFQNIGEDFDGFDSMRESKSTSDASLQQLEKEKGIKRMNLSASVPAGSGAGVQMNFGQISNDGSDIINQAFGYKCDWMSFDYSFRNIDKDFSRFTDLKETDRAQMASEAGIKRTQYALNIGQQNANDFLSSLGLTQLQSETGTLTNNTVSLDAGIIKLHADIRNMDSTFDDMTALNDQERIRMALDARRQFDPTAKEKDVTSADKSKINQEYGLNRANYSVEFDSGPVNTWLSMSSVDSENGGLSHSALKFMGKDFSVYIDRHAIDSTFTRISSLQAIEKTNYGNERGMARTTMGGNLKTGFGELAMKRAFVTDENGAGVLRQSLNFNGPRLKFKANFQKIDSDFSRISDLSDSDRAVMLNERGFSRNDLSLNFKATNDLNIDSYLYRSTNADANQALGQRKFNIAYSPKQGPKITTLHDTCSYISDSGEIESYTHNRVALENSFAYLGGLCLGIATDTNTSQEGDDIPVDTRVTEARMQINTNAPVSLMMNLAKTDISDKSEINGSFGINWTINKNLKMSATIDNRSGDIKGAKRDRKFSLNGRIARKFLIFNDVSVGSGVNTTNLMGRQTGCDNALKLKAGVIGNGSFLIDNSDKLNTSTGLYYASRLIQYESDKDLKKWYHLSLMRQKITSAAGETTEKRNYTFDARLFKQTSVAFNRHFGRDAIDGEVSPVGGTTIKLKHILSDKLTAGADFTSDFNESTEKSARIVGLGVAGQLSNSAQFELYFGWSRLNEDSMKENGNVFRIKYDYKISSDRYISLTAEKRSGVENTNTSTYEGDTTARLDLKTTFN